MKFASSLVLLLSSFLATACGKLQPSALSHALHRDAPTTFPSEFAGSATCLLGDEMFFFGGKIKNREEPDDRSDEIFSQNTKTGEWKHRGRLTYPAAYETATFLNDHEILLSGSGLTLYNSDQSSTWHVTSHCYGSKGHSATKLSQEKVLIVGGLEIHSQANDQSVIFDRGTDREKLRDPSGKDSYDTQQGPEMIQPRGYHAATLLKNGQVMVSGGLGPPCFRTIKQGTEFVDWGRYGTPSRKTYQEAWKTHAHCDSNLNDTLYCNFPELGYYKLTREQILNGPSLENHALNTIEIYDYKKDKHFQEVTNTMQEKRFLHTTTVLPDETVLIAGGFGDGKHGFQALNSMEIFDPIKHKTTRIPAQFQSARGAHAATLLGEKWVLFAGGSRAYSTKLYDGNHEHQEVLRSIEVFDIKKKEFLRNDQILAYPRAFHQSFVRPGTNFFRVFFTPGASGFSPMEYLDFEIEKVSRE